MSAPSSQDRNHPSVRVPLQSLSSRGGSRSTVSQGRSACGQATFNLRNNGPKGTKNDAGSSDTPKRSCEVLPLGEKVKVLNFIEDGKDSPIREPVKREKEMCATFAAASGAAQVTVSV